MTEKLESLKEIKYPIKYTATTEENKAQLIPQETEVYKSTV